MSADKYAAFVWPAYGVTALVFGWMIVDTLLRAARWKRRAGDAGAKRDDPP